MVRLPVFRAFWAATTAPIARIPAASAIAAIATVTVTAVVLGLCALSTLLASCCAGLFVGMFSATTVAAIAFQPYSANNPLPIDATWAQHVRSDIGSDRHNRLRCIADANMVSHAQPNPVLHNTTQQSVPAAITDNTAALLPDIEDRIATIPNGSDFFPTYAFVLTAINRATTSWNEYIPTVNALGSATPDSAHTAITTAARFFTPESDLEPTQAIAAAVMLRLTAAHTITGDQNQATTLLDEALQHCRLGAPPQ